MHVVGRPMLIATRIDLAAWKLGRSVRTISKNDRHFGTFGLLSVTAPQRLRRRRCAVAQSQKFFTAFHHRGELLPTRQNTRCSVDDGGGH
jgi:hypothetical protein